MPARKPRHAAWQDRRDAEPGHRTDLVGPQHRRRPGYGSTPVVTDEDGLLLPEASLSMDPNRYEVSEPELLRGLRLS